MKKFSPHFIFIESACIFAVFCLVFVCTIFRYGLTDAGHWLLPLNYNGDALHLLGLFEAVSRGEFLPYGSFFVSTLGAPFAANWNDYPVTCPLLLLSGGLLTNWFGLGLSANILLVLAHLVSGVAMFLCLRLIGVSRIWAFTFSICFGLAPFLFNRGFGHLAITFAYSVPITCALCYIIYKNGSDLLTGWRLVLVLAVAFYFGGIFPYYTAFFLIIMAFSALYCFLNEKKLRSVAPFLLIAICSITHFFIITSPFREYSEVYGKNNVAVSRYYGSLQVVALRPIEMFLPGSGSRVPFLNKISQFYEQQDVFRKKFEYSESMMAYLGLPGVIGFIILIFLTGYFILTKRQQLISGWFWLVSAFMAFAVIGGINGFLGLGKFYLLRSSNRVSIFILAACLFFLALLLTRLSNKLPKTMQFLIAFVLAGTTCFEALPAKASSRGLESLLWDSDKQMVADLENILPQGAMVFNYPVIDFPESGPYAYLRPYFFSDHLRFSFGSIKGRSREAWQEDVSNMEPAEMLNKLEEYGFSGVLLFSGSDLDKNHRAAALNMLDFFKNNGLPAISSEAGDFHFLQLQPSAHPKIPEGGPLFIKNWWENSIQPDIPAIRSRVEHETGMPNWATHQSAIVEFYVSGDRVVTLQGEIASICDAKVQIFYGKEKLWEGHAGSERWVRFKTASFKVSEGAFRLEFKNDCGPVIHGGRKFNFGVLGLTLDNIPNSDGSIKIKN